MTTTTLERTDTGSHAVVTDVTSAATPMPWVAKTPDHIHDDLCRRVQPAEWAGEPTPEAGHYVPDTEDLRKQIDLTMASYRLVLHNEFIARQWHEVASQAWAHQGATSRISEQYTDKREALLTAYRRECEAIKTALIRGLPTAAPLPELHPARELAPDRLDADAPRRRKALAQAALGERRELPAPSKPEAAEAEPDGWVSDSWWARTLAWIGSRREKRGA